MGTAGTVGTASGKLLLFGEHAAVHGYPALGMALPWETRVFLQKTDLPEWQLPELLPDEIHNLKNLLMFFQEAFPALRKLGAMELQIMSDVPEGMGFGSSAALVVAFLKAIVTLTAGKFFPDVLVKEIGRSIDIMWNMANKAERLFHGKPSGIDTGLALLGDMQAFQFSGQPLPQNRQLKGHSFYLVVGAVPRESNTRDLVGALHERILAGDTGIQKIMGELGEIASLASKKLSSKKQDLSAQLGILADEAHAMLQKLGVSSPALDTVLEEGRNRGALGGKLSGAGGGGAFYLVVRDEMQGHMIAANLRNILAGLYPGQSLPVAVLVKQKKGVSICPEPQA